MRIIMGKDFYDSGLAYGQDDDLTFIRNSQTFNADNFKKTFNGFPTFVELVGITLFNPNDKSHKWFSSSNSVRFKDKREVMFFSNYVIFAGKKYNYLDVYETFPTAPYKVKQRFWSKHAFEQFVSDRKLEYKPSRFIHREPVTLDEFFTPKSSKELTNYLIKERISILSRTSYMLSSREANVEFTVDGDNLKALEFQKVIDPYTAFQELSMWVGNLPRNPNTMVEITDDKIKAAKHSMDKWSFRRTSAEKPNS